MDLKAIFISILILFASFLSIAQSVVWSEKIGEQNLDDRAYYIAESVDNHLLICGFKNIAEITYGYDTIIEYDIYFNPIDTNIVYGPISTIKKQAFAVKSDLDGNVIFQNIYGGNEDEEAIKIIENNNTFWLATNTNSTDLLNNFGGTDIVFYQLDFNFNLINEIRIGGTKNDFVNDFVIENNKIYFTGYAESGSFLSDSLGINDLIYGVYDLNLSNYNIFTFGGSGHDEGTNIKILNDEVFIAGQTRSTDGNISFNNGNRDSWLIKIDKNTGILLDEKCFGGSAGDVSVDLIIKQNEIYLLSETASNNGDVTYIYGSGDFWLLKADENLNLLWQKTYGGSSIDNPESIVLMDDDNILLAGGTFSNNGTISNNFAFIDSWIAKINSNNGDVIWEFTLGGFDLDYTYRAINLSNGNIAVAGYSDSPSISIAKTLHTLHDFWFALIDPFLVDIYNDFENENENIQIETHLNKSKIFNNSVKNLTFLVYDINSKLLLSFKILAFEQKTIDYKQFNSGIYFLNEQKSNLSHKFIVNKP